MVKVLTAFVERSSGRLVAVLLVTALGLAAAGLTGPGGHGLAVTSPWYLWGVNALLAVGLYGSASGITRDAVEDVRIVVAAVTVGVALKAALIAAVMYLASGSTTAMILGVAVAQIDPLSVTAMIGRSKMSGRARSLLLAWASFDDPVTALLTVYLVTTTLSPAAGGSMGGLASYGAGLAANAAFAAAAGAAWWLAARRPARRPLKEHPAFPVVATVLLAGLLALAAWQFLMLGVALVGLFYRPRGVEALVGRVTSVAFYLAAFVLGMLLIGGVDVGLGLVLGLAAFGAQVVAGLLIGRRFDTADRVRLALGQQNGITAIILALALQPHVPAAVRVIAPAILTVNVLHIVANAVWDRIPVPVPVPVRGGAHAPRPAPVPAPFPTFRPLAVRHVLAMGSHTRKR
ncbi:hypothetical protein [Sphaerisporangium krabiense]|uniref:Cation/H+ exchanger domain-containing protein n=1 Tax=Sphaerisporangium krabiense TaxID=763782 RepID=A0A7W9DRV0_9ACTN|nr:hypothetical protein [Sphaerisporangium krabiense]MBB5628853.1 hypothetical protein [Sphaerisporangium krabiense]